MEGEQATLPFVVPSHLSKLFGLKASVIVEREGAGGRDESERQGGRKRKRGGAPRANSTCWGDGETAVTKGGGVKKKRKTPELTSSCVLPSSLFIATNSPYCISLFCSSFYLHPQHILSRPWWLLTETGNIRDAVLKLGWLTNWLSGSIGKRRRKKNARKKQSESKDGVWVQGR